MYTNIEKDPEQLDDCLDKMQYVIYIIKEKRIMNNLPEKEYVM